MLLAVQTFLMPCLPQMVEKTWPPLISLREHSIEPTSFVQSRAKTLFSILVSLYYLYTVRTLSSAPATPRAFWPLARFPQASRNHHEHPGRPFYSNRGDYVMGVPAPEDQRGEPHA